MLFCALGLSLGVASVLAMFSSYSILTLPLFALAMTFGEFKIAIDFPHKSPANAQLRCHPICVFRMDTKFPNNFNATRARSNRSRGVGV